MNVLFDVSEVLVEPEVNPWLYVNTHLGMTPEEDERLGQLHKHHSVYNKWIQAVIEGWKPCTRAEIEDAGRHIPSPSQKITRCMRELMENGHTIGLLSTLPDVILQGFGECVEVDRVNVHSPNTLIFNEERLLQGVKVATGSERQARLALVRNRAWPLDEIAYAGASSNAIELMFATGLSFAPVGSKAAQIGAAKVVYQDISQIPSLLSVRTSRETQ